MKRASEFDFFELQIELQKKSYHNSCILTNAFLSNKLSIILISTKIEDTAMMHLLGSLFVEATVVGVVCIFFMILMVVAGIKQILKDRE